MYNEYYEENNKSKYFKGYGIYVLILTFVLIMVLAVLWFKLSSFQKDTEDGGVSDTGSGTESMYSYSDEEIERAVQSAFTSYLEGMGETQWISLYRESHPECLENDNNISQFITEKIINSGYECYKDAEYSLNKPVYLLMKGDDILASFEMSGSDLNWSVAKADVLIEGLESFEAYVPADCILYINDNAVTGEDYIKDSQTASVSEYDEDLSNPTMWNHYVITGLIRQPEVYSVRVEGNNGDSTRLSADGYYYRIINEENAASYSDTAEKFVRTLLDYYAKGKDNYESNMSAVLSYVASGSAAAAVIRETASGMEWMTPDYSVRYITVPSDVYILSDNCICVDITYSKENSEEEAQTEEGIYRVYLLDAGNGYKIVQFAGIK